MAARAEERGERHRRAPRPAHFDWPHSLTSPPADLLALPSLRLASLDALLLASLPEALSLPLLCTSLPLAALLLSPLRLAVLWLGSLTLPLLLVSLPLRVLASLLLSLTLPSLMLARLLE